MYDITKEETFDDLPKWMKMIDKVGAAFSEMLVLIVAKGRRQRLQSVSFHPEHH